MTADSGKYLELQFFVITIRELVRGGGKGVNLEEDKLHSGSEDVSCDPDLGLAAPLSHDSEMELIGKAVTVMSRSHMSLNLDCCNIYSGQ